MLESQITGRQLVLLMLMSMLPDNSGFENRTTDTSNIEFLDTSRKAKSIFDDGFSGRYNQIDLAVEFDNPGKSIEFPALSENISQRNMAVQSMSILWRVIELRDKHVIDNKADFVRAAVDKFNYELSLLYSTQKWNRLFTNIFTEDGIPILKFENPFSIVRMKSDIEKIAKLEVFGLSGDSLTFESIFKKARLEGIQHNRDEIRVAVAEAVAVKYAQFILDYYFRR